MKSPQIAPAYLRPTGFRARISIFYFLGLSTTKFDPIAREFLLIARVFGKINRTRCT